MAREISEICKRVGVQFVYKSSFDKANRSSAESFRGQGMEFGLEVLAEVKSAVGVPIITDIHEPSQADEAARLPISCRSRRSFAGRPIYWSPPRKRVKPLT